MSLQSGPCGPASRKPQKPTISGMGGLTDHHLQASRIFPRSHLIRFLHSAPASTWEEEPNLQAGSVLPRTNSTGENRGSLLDGKATKILRRHEEQLLLSILESSVRKEPMKVQAKQWIMAYPHQLATKAGGSHPALHPPVSPRGRQQ